MAQIQATLEDQRTKLLPELLDGIRETNGRLDDLEKACTGQLEPADLSNLSAQVVAVHLATIEHAKRTARRGAQDLQTLLLLATVCASGWLIWKRRR